MQVNAVDDSLCSNAWGDFFDGSEPQPLSRAESELRDQILVPTMSETDALSLLKSIDTTVPYRTRKEFVAGVAAVCALRPAEVSRKVTGANKEVRRILWSACSPERLEWLWNNIRLHHAMTPLERAFLGSGTSSNESLHHEINSWLRSTQAMHRSTLLLKARYMHFGKLITHHNASRHPFGRVTTEGLVLARAVTKPIWTLENWRQWCADQKTDGMPAKAKLPLHTSRKHEEASTRNWIAKRPAAKTSRQRIKRTPLNAKRQHKLRGGGVKKKT
jgi:hypothetical protein